MWKESRISLFYQAGEGLGQGRHPKSPGKVAYVPLPRQASHEAAAQLTRELIRGFTPMNAGNGLNGNTSMSWLAPTCLCGKVSDLGLTKEFAQALGTLARTGKVPG